MALGYDGSIRIDTSMNSKGFNTGISSMTKAVRGLALALGLALSVTAVIAFGRASVQTASEMTSAFIGLRSIVDGTGNSFSKAQKFIEQYISDGLIPAADAVTAYKNLLARGYSTDQVEKTLLRLKDSAAFGRQSSLTLGQAVRSATEGLKNENSILVDNAGVTKNVSILWKEYAESVGKGVQSLTKEEKITAEVNGIMRETRFQLGDAAKLSSTYSGQVSALSTSFTMLKASVGNVFIPILTRLIPPIKAAIDALTQMFTRLATIMNILFGVDIGLNQTAQAMNDTAAATTDASSAQDDLAASTKKSGEAAKGALAAFDELNVLAKPATEDAAAVEDIKVPAIDTAPADESLNGLKDRVLKFKQDLLDLFAPAIESFKKLMVVLEPLGREIINGLGWAWENILVPFGKWAIESFLPKFIDLLAAGFRLLNAVLEPLKPLLEAIWENVLKPIAGAAGDLILISIEGWTMAFNDLATWLEGHPDLFGEIGASINSVKDKVGSVLEEILTKFKNVWKTMSEWTLQNNPFIDMLDALGSTIIDVMNKVLAAIAAGINGVLGMINSVRIDVPEWVPGLGGQSWSTNIPYIHTPVIPKLATGAVIPPNSQFLAVLGDQRSGRNLEAPEDLIRQIVREESQQQAVDVSMPVYLDGELVYKNQKRIEARRGKSLLTAGSVA